jgi:hypothetical protein
VQPDEVLKDPALEARARALSQTLRCMVCQNESIDESNAPLARDLRILVRERIEAGDSDAEVRNSSSRAMANSSCSRRGSTRARFCSGRPRCWCCWPAESVFW